jgi:hypothetical protein
MRTRIFAQLEVSLSIGRIEHADRLERQRNAGPRRAQQDLCLEIVAFPANAERERRRDGVPAEAALRIGKRPTCESRKEEIREAIRESIRARSPGAGGSRTPSTRASSGAGAWKTRAASSAGCCPSRVHTEHHGPTACRCLFERGPQRGTLAVIVALVSASRTAGQPRRRRARARSRRSDRASRRRYEDVDPRHAASISVKTRPSVRSASNAGTTMQAWAWRWHASILHDAGAARSPEDNGA